VDGWRALSIIMVLGSHSTELPGFSRWCGRLPTYVPWLFDGNLGVRFFFVISGFLITYLLIREQQHEGRVSLKNFYIRRALRILPVYGAYLAVAAIIQCVVKTPGEAHQWLITWIGDLTFTVNFLPRGVLSGHLWSLSVEEQFYLIWPATFIWLSHHGKKARWILALPVLVAIACHVISYTGHVPWMIHPLFHHHSSLVNFDSIAVGCLAAFALSEHENAMRQFLTGGKKWLAILIGILLIGLAPLKLPLVWPIQAVTINLWQAAGFALLLLTSILQPGNFRFWNWPVVVRLGVISYSVYIWQQFYFAGPQTYGMENVWWMSFPGWLLPAIATGFVSYYGFERPLLKLRNRFRRD
jgi:peptidoglycan/LPS O-acetylase OafA/YrhL